MMWRIFRLWLIALILLIGPVTVSAQGVDPETEPSAQIRFVHGIANIQAVDIYLDGELIKSNLSFGDATNYGLTGTGTKLISILASTTDGNIGQSLLDKSLELNTGYSYTLALSGNEIQTDISLFEDDTGASNDSQGSLRIVNLAQQNGIAAAINDAAFTSIINYGSSSSRKFIDKSNTSPVVSILDKTGNLLLSTEPIFLGNGEFYTLFVMNSGSGLQYTSTNYALTSGELPTSSIWIPVASFDNGEEPASEQPSEEQPSEEQPSEEQPSEEQSAVEQPAVEQPVVEQPAVEQPAVEQPSEEQPSEEQSAVEQPAVEQQTSEQLATEQLSEEQNSEGQHSEGESAGADEQHAEEPHSEGESAGAEAQHAEEQPAETDEQHAEGQHAEGEQGEHSTEGETLESLLPVPLWMLIGCSLLVVLLLLGGSWLWWVAFHRDKR